MANGVPEGLYRLPREGSPAGVRDGHRDHDGQLGAELVLDLGDRVQGGLRVQRVEDGLDEEDVDAAFDEGPALESIGVRQLVEDTFRTASHLMIDELIVHHDQRL